MYNKFLCRLPRQFILKFTKLGNGKCCSLLPFEKLIASFFFRKGIFFPVLLKYQLKLVRARVSFVTFSVSDLSTVKWLQLEFIFVSMPSLNYRCSDPKQIIYYTESERLLNRRAYILLIFPKPPCYFEHNLSAKYNCQVPDCIFSLLGDFIGNNSHFTIGIFCSVLF